MSPLHPTPINSLGCNTRALWEGSPAEWEVFTLQTLSHYEG